MSRVPAYLQDIKELLSKDGFAAGDVWYHGTSSALLDSIKAQGLKRSGDKAMKQAAKSTMATIGNSFSESIEPVFLTQSKELAYYWATQTVRDRGVRISGEASPVVLAINLPEELREKVRPDVGAAGLLMVEGGGKYVEYLDEIYQQYGFEVPDIDPANVNRTAYLSVLGMAYYDKDIEAQYMEELSE